jgi:hypothetical protein
MRSDSLVRGLTLAGGLPAPRQQRVNLLGGMIGDAGVHVPDRTLGRLQGGRADMIRFARVGTAT